MLVNISVKLKDKNFPYMIYQMMFIKCYESKECEIWSIDLFYLWFDKNYVNYTMIYFSLFYDCEFLN